MSSRARLFVAVAIAVLSGIGIAVLAVNFFDDSGGRARSPVRFAERDAVAPFAGYREARLEIGGRCERVVLADTEARRVEGLRGHVDLGPYLGMLFVNRANTDGAFTMAGVSQPLEIAWYAADGARVDGAHLAPCPRRAEADCPIYRSRGRYRLALETPRGSTFAGSIGPCS